MPTFNEEAVIEKRIQNLRALRYPKDKYEILVIDSGSSDATKSIVQRLCAEGGAPQTKLVCEDQRMGKASAINCGSAQAAGDIILVTDANSFFDANVLAELGPHFERPEIGGVGGRYMVSNPDNPLPLTEQFYWELETLLRTGESALDSACLFQGEINAWRKCIVDADTAMIGEDLDMSIAIRKKGYKVAFEPNAICYEPSPTSFSEQKTQKKRRCLGTIQNIFKHWRYLFVPRDWYRAHNISVPQRLAYGHPLYVCRNITRLHGHLEPALSAEPSIYHVRTFSDPAHCLPAVRAPIAPGSRQRPAREVLLPSSRTIRAFR